MPSGAFQGRLATVEDGGDFRCEGFAALIDALQDGALPEKSTSGFSRTLSSPQESRGDWFTLTGTIEQISPLPELEWQSVTECFVRDANQELFVLYVLDGATLNQQTSLRAEAMFYKTIVFKGRDGVERSYPSFVTERAFVNQSQTAEFPLQFLSLLICGGVLLLFCIYRMSSKAPRSRSRRSHHVDETTETTEATIQELSDDPAEALAQMYDSSKEFS